MSKTIGWACGLAVVGLMVACGTPGGGEVGKSPDTAPRPRPEPQTETGAPKTEVPKPYDWSKAGSTAQVGDVKVEVMWAAAWTAYGSRFGRVENYGTFAIKFRLTNQSKAKLARFEGWQGDLDTLVTDEHGNEYKRLSFNSGWAFDSLPRLKADEDEGCNADAIIIHRNFSLHPEKCYTTCIFREPPVAAAKEARITVSAKELGGEGLLRMKATIARPKN
jgi:hypothetical protein